MCKGKKESEASNFLVLTTFFAFENMMFGYKSIAYFEGLFYIKILLRILGMEMLSHKTMKCKLVETN